MLSLVLQGVLKGFDQTINLILDESHERVYSSSEGVEQVILGLYIVRGDNVYVPVTHLNVLGVAAKKSSLHSAKTQISLNNCPI